MKKKRKEREKRSRETHYNEERYGHGLKESNKKCYRKQNQEKYNRKAVRERELESNEEQVKKTL